MKRIFNIFVIAIATLFGAAYLAGCASSETSRATGQVIDDASITARVKTALAKEAGVGKSLDVDVTTYRGTVQLSGFVETRELANRAGELARTVDGVRSVRNDIVVAGSAQPKASSGSSAR